MFKFLFKSKFLWFVEAPVGVSYDFNECVQVIELNYVDVNDITEFRYVEQYFEMILFSPLCHIV